MRLLIDESPLPEKTLKLSPFATIGGRVVGHNVAKSAVRALEILELIVESGAPLRAIEVARSLEISPSSANQILKTMMDNGYLIFDTTTKRYVISARLTRLSSSLSVTYFGPDAITRLLRSVHAVTGEHVLLVASQGSFMQIIDACGPSGGVRRESKGFRRSTSDLKGVQFSIFGSCAGAVWLASQPEDVILKTIQRCRRELGRQASDVDRVLESLHRVRDQGFAFGGLMIDEGVESVAVGLPPGANGVVLVLAVCAPSHAIEQSSAEIAQLIRDRIDDCLGPVAYN